jgi:glycogen debranching enzyme
MGESERAGTKGLPGTSRDGAPVEITGLLKSTLSWAASLSEQGVLKQSGVEVTGKIDFLLLRGAAVVDSKWQ